MGVTMCKTITPPPCRTSLSRALSPPPHIFRGSCSPLICRSSRAVLHAAAFLPPMGEKKVVKCGEYLVGPQSHHLLPAKPPPSLATKKKKLAKGANEVVGATRALS